jgi:hypothetical protein
LPRERHDQLRQGDHQQLVAVAWHPVAVIGLGYFTVMTLLVMPMAWQCRFLDPLPTSA